MSLTPGTRLGVYDIIASIGEGGMGAVFRARDGRFLINTVLDNTAPPITLLMNWNPAR